MQFIVSGQRIAVENFVTGKLYTILWKNDTQVTLTCISIGADCVVFQGEAPLNLFTLTMQNADTIDTIEPTQLGTTNYNNLINKPSINGVDLIGNKTSAALGIRDVPAIIESDDGKILTASSDGTYTWQPAPSSGTMDYTQLNNKPQINSVTLTGNVSLADLGAAAAADIPTTPADIGAEPAITSENMLDADLVDDTSSTHKFATAAQLAQIGTNENNISLIEHAVGTKLFFTEIKPTGTITVGSYWISTTGTRVYVISPNLYDYTATDTNNGYVDNTWLRNDGTTVSDNDYEISEYIEVKPNTVYTLTLGATLNSPSVCYYNSSKNYISGDAYSQENPKIVTTPSNAKYIRLSVQKAVEENVTVKEGTTGYIWQ